MGNWGLGVRLRKRGGSRGGGVGWGWGWDCYGWQHEMGGSAPMAKQGRTSLHLVKDDPRDWPGADENGRKHFLQAPVLMK